MQRKEAQRIKDLGRYPMPDNESVALPRGPMKRVQIECNTPLHTVAAKVERHAVGGQLPFTVSVGTGTCEFQPPSEDAATNALLVQEKAAELKRAKEEKLQQFQADLLKRVAKRKKEAAVEQEAKERLQPQVTYKPDLWSMSGSPRFKTDDDSASKSQHRTSRTTAIKMTDYYTDESMDQGEEGTWEYVGDEGGPTHEHHPPEGVSRLNLGQLGLSRDQEEELHRLDLAHAAPTGSPRIIQEAEQLPIGPVRYRAVITAEAAEERLRVQQQREEEEKAMKNKMNELRKSQEERLNALNKEREDRSNAIAELEAAQAAASAAKAASAMAMRRDEVERTRYLKKSRFNTALHVRLLAKVNQMGLTLPPLCNCPHGVQPLDEAYPFHCSNNCILYHNPEAYSTMLAHVLHAFGVLE